MKISQLAKITGVSAKMIRYYESIGLIPEASRHSNGYRNYHDHDIERLQFIAQARQLGFSLEKIAILLQLQQNQDRHSADVKQIAEQHVAILNAKIQQLQEMKQQLEAWIIQCAGNDQPECAILKNICKKSD